MKKISIGTVALLIILAMALAGLFKLPAEKEYTRWL